MGEPAEKSKVPRIPSTLLKEVVAGQVKTPSQPPSLLREVIFGWWKISLRKARETHEDFLENLHLQDQTALIFGKFDFLEWLSDDLLLNIISYLDLEDIARLCQTSHRFKLCMSDKLWEQIVQSICDTITPDVRSLAEDTGWRQLFFTNKLQLQRQLCKRKQKYGSLREKQP
uniref:F-box domain-containing protein n=1 Tax=Gorilla gorilla gorilla TaxID=9595 RepID=A0A2I2ZUL0_GORGO